MHILYVCLQLICELCFQYIMCQSLEFKFLFACFKLACLTFDQSVCPILLYFKLHDLYVCLHLICEFYYQLRYYVTDFSILIQYLLVFN